MAPPARDLRALPKAHLHVHLEGAIRPSTVADLAERAGRPAPEFRAGEGFDGFLAAYDAVCDLIRSPDDVRRLFVEVADDARQEGCVWMEPHVYPPLLSRHLGDPVGILELMVEAASDAASSTGVGIGLLVSADRSGSPEEAEHWAKVAGRFAGRGVTTFGLAGDESRYPADPFSRAFSMARDAGLVCAPHAGELAGAEAVRDAIAALKPDRLAHGVRISEDDAVVDEVVASGLVCDVCPTSNVILGVCPSIGDHPVSRLVEAGVAVSLNADDPLFVGSSLNGEYERVRAELGFGDEVLAGIARTSVDASAAPPEVKASARAVISAWLDDDGGGGREAAIPGDRPG